MPDEPFARRSELPPLGGLTLGDALTGVRRIFGEAGIDTPGLDARRLIASVVGLEPGDVLLASERKLLDHEAERLIDFARRRLAREPVSRILGRRHFHGLELELSPATLDPRPETETLVDGVLDLVRLGPASGDTAPRLLDLGTGSGAILLALLAALPAATGLGIDQNAAALAEARRNAARLGIQDRARFQVSDWLRDVDGTFDIIVSNPPYIPSGAIAGLDPEVRLFDPHAALDGGADGLDAYRTLIPQAVARLRPGGWLVLEVGELQSDVVARLARTTGAASEIRVWPDLAGIPRCVAVRHQ